MSRPVSRGELESGNLTNLKTMLIPDVMMKVDSAPQVELIMSAPTTTWVGLGWRPLTATKTCQVEKTNTNDSFSVEPNI